MGFALTTPKKLGRGGPAHNYAPKQEQTTATQLQGRTIPGSGAGPWSKSDVRTRGRVRVECKATGKLTYRVSMDDLRKLADSVNGTDEVPVMQVDLGVDKQGRRYGRFYVVSALDMEDLLDRLVEDAGDHKGD